jgi:hypothetical protein
MKIALAVVLFLVLAGAAVRLAAHRNRQAFLAEVEAARAASPPQPSSPITEEDLAALPPPVAAYLRSAGAVGRRRVSAARVRHGGRFRPSPERGWYAIEGDYLVTTGVPQFLWWGRLRLAPLVDVVARDGFALGRGRMLVKALGAVPVVDERGPAMDQAGFDRLLAELTLVPTALLTGPHLRWEPVDEGSARAFLSHGGREASMLFRHDPGAHETVVEMERGRQEGERVVKRKFRARASGEPLRAGGFTLRRRVQGTWVLPEGDLDYVDFELESAELE